MRISTYTAQVIRKGIMEAKLDLAAGAENHEHEPAAVAASCVAFNAYNFMTYNRLEEEAYWHIMHEAKDVSAVQPAQMSQSRLAFG